MNRLIQRLINKVMSAFVGSGVSIDEHGGLRLPDGLTPHRVRGFIELCMDRPFDSPRSAIHGLFGTIGVPADVISLLDRVIDKEGTIEFAVATRHSAGLLAAIPEFKRIPDRFRDFLVIDLGVASGDCGTLEEAVVSARENAAKRVGCAATWDAIIQDGDALREITRPWREANL